MGRTKHFIAVAVLVVVSTVALYFILVGLLRLPAAASAQSVPIDILFHAHFWMIAFLFSLIMVMMLYAAFVFRRQPGDEEEGPHVHGSTGLEVGWTIVPTVIVIGFGIWGAVVLNNITAPQPDEMVVKVTGRQWSWTFEYPEQEEISSAELVLPVDQPVLLEMSSEDVLHSFWVPEFRVKQDLVPGRTTTLRITPTQEGEYRVRCAEICGQQHSAMLAPVRVVPEADFIAWAEEAADIPVYAELSPAERGAIWYSNADGFACEGCHSLDGTPGAGPTWQNLFGKEEELTDGTTVVVDEEYIRESILDPNAKITAGFQPNVMPQNFEERFTQRQEEILSSQNFEVNIIEDLIAFIQAQSESAEE